MELSKKERRILWNQYEILRRLDPEGEDYYRKLQVILEDGYARHYEHSFFDHLSDELPEEVSQEVFDTLNMFEAIGDSLRELDDDQELDRTFLKFSGYDGNNECDHMGYVGFLVRHDQRYLHVVPDHTDFNSHCPMRAAYGSMYRAWSGLGKPKPMGADQLAQVAAAATNHSGTGDHG